MAFLKVGVSYFSQLLKRVIRTFWADLSYTSEAGSSYGEPFFSQSSLSLPTPPRLLNQQWMCESRIVVKTYTEVDRLSYRLI